MSVKRLFHWKCDHCDAEEVREGYGLPAGWTYHQKLLNPVTHKCSGCNSGKPFHGEHYKDADEIIAAYKSGDLARHYPMIVEAIEKMKSN